jgi:hypothetical protein
MFVIAYGRFCIDSRENFVDFTSLLNKIWTAILPISLRISIHVHSYKSGNRNRSVRTVTRFRFGRPGLDSRQRQGFFPSSPHPDWFWGPPGLLCSRYRDSFSRVKQPGREFANPPPPTAEFMNAWSYTSTPSHVFMVWRVMLSCCQYLGAPSFLYP